MPVFVFLLHSFIYSERDSDATWASAQGTDLFYQFDNVKVQNFSEFIYQLLMHVLVHRKASSYIVVLGCKLIKVFSKRISFSCESWNALDGKLVHEPRVGAHFEMSDLTVDQC